LIDIEKKVSYLNPKYLEACSRRLKALAIDMDKINAKTFLPEETEIKVNESKDLSLDSHFT
jgi:hypothetical protein